MKYKTIGFYDIKLPAWSVCYLVNADASGLADEELDQVDKFWSFYEQTAKEAGGFAYLSLDTAEEGNEASFCRRPEFGLATDCFDAIVLMLKN